MVRAPLLPSYHLLPSSSSVSYVQGDRRVSGMESHFRGTLHQAVLVDLYPRGQVDVPQSGVCQSTRVSVRQVTAGRPYMCQYIRSILPYLWS